MLSRDERVAIRAARTFDARSGRMLANPVIVVRGDRIAEAGSGVMKGGLIARNDLR
jgi:hypothetical protein